MNCNNNLYGTIVSDHVFIREYEYGTLKVIDSILHLE